MVIKTSELMAVACFVAFMVFTRVRTNVVEASTRSLFSVNPQDHEPSQYITITGEFYNINHIKFKLYMPWKFSTPNPINSI